MWARFSAAAVRRAGSRSVPSGLRGRARRVVSTTAGRAATGGAGDAGDAGGASEASEGSEAVAEERLSGVALEDEYLEDTDLAVPSQKTPPRRAIARPEVTAIEGIRVVAEDEPARNFDESVELSLGLGLDPRKPNQSLRVMTQLPHGSGKQSRIAVFARGEDAERALTAGAAIVGAEDLAEEIQTGNTAFPQCIAT
eukprot:g3349.t1